MKRRIAALMRKEALHIRRDPRSLYLAVGLPVLMLLLFGYAMTLEVKHVALGIIDQDGTKASRELIARVTSSDYFQLRFISTDPRVADRRLDDGTARIVLVVPRDFARSLGRGEKIAVQLLVDGSDSNTALIAMGYLSLIIQSTSQHLLVERLEHALGEPKALFRERCVPDEGVIFGDQHVCVAVAVQVDELEVRVSGVAVEP